MSKLNAEIPMGSADHITNLQAQLHSLRHRLHELEIENAKLSFQLLNCRCQKQEESLDSNVGDGVCSIDNRKDGGLETGANVDSKIKKSAKRVSDCNTLPMHHYPKRFVALKVMYFGQRFYGFASEAHMDPTIESEIFKALGKTRLLVGDRKESQYSRCGRTDKGVSSVGQVIAMFLRSNLKENGCGNRSSDEEIILNEREGEIDYVRVLNGVLPEDIRVLGWCPAPIDFHARFSCLSRDYKYLFWTEDLNLTAMQSAGQKFVGEHDFRNFCKMDAVNVHNYRRNISCFEISPSSERFGENQLYALRIIGSAFLWHQVRCMVAVLFMIGRGLESPNVIDAFLDTERTCRKPQYVMAPEVPLVLQSCEFEGLKFTCSSVAKQALCMHLENECRTYKLRAAIFHEALLSCSLVADDESSLSSRTVKKASHVPLLSRPTEPSYEERRAKLKSRT